MHAHAPRSLARARRPEGTNRAPRCWPSTSRDGLEVDTEIREGYRIEATEFRLRALHTPGHTSNHLCYLLEEERLLFSGDHIMQGSTVVIAPPDGDMAQYLESLERVRRPAPEVIAPGHGHLIDDPNAVIDDYIEHRLERERQVLEAVRAGDRTTAEVVARLSPGSSTNWSPRARQTVHAHLRKLASEGTVTTQDVDDADGEWSPIAS